MEIYRGLLKQTQMKTIKELYETLPEPYRTQAINNSYNKDEMFSSLYDALLSGFLWSETPEGFDYWNDYVDSIIDIDDYEI